MGIIVKNYCYNYGQRITPQLVKKITKAYSDLQLADLDVFLYFLDWDPDWTEYGGGWHEYGKDGSVIQVQVAKPDITPHVMLYFLACHELRHSYQSYFNKFNEKEHLEVLDACLKKDGLKKPTPEFMRKWHDAFPEEVDADTWASSYTQFDGNAWWRQVIDKNCKTKSISVSDFKLKS